MKQTTGWNKASSKPGFNKGGRRVNGGGYSLKYPAKRPGSNKAFKTNALFETIKERLNYTLKSLAGKKVILKKENGVVLEGVLIGSNGESLAGKGITLCYVKVTSKPEKAKENYTFGANKYYTKWNDLVYIQGKDSEPKSMKTDKLKTDADITRRNIMSGNIAGRTLQSPDASWVKKNGAAKETLESSTAGGVWDQFKVNEEKFGVKGTYDENIYTTKLDKTKLTQDQINSAKQTAKEIENKSTTNFHRKEERNQKVDVKLDEEAKYSAVSRNQISGQATIKPLSYSDILMKGKLEAANKSEDENELDGTNSPNERKQIGKGGLTTPTAPDDDGKHGSREKYKVSDVDFSAYKKAAQAKIAIHTPSSKNWPAHDLTRKKLEGVNKKSRDQQIMEFKSFSSSLEAKKKDTRKQLNVNAKEFKPPGAIAYQPPPQMFQQFQKPKDSQGKPAEAPNAAAPATTQRVAIKQGTVPKQQNIPQAGGQVQGQAYIPQQNFWPVGMGPVPGGVNFVHPVVIPPGAQHYPVYSQGPNGNPIIIPQGHPYFVQMMPPGAAIQHPYHQQPQSQHFAAAGFHQPVMQVVPQAAPPNQAAEHEAHAQKIVKNKPNMQNHPQANQNKPQKGGGGRFNQPSR